ncbi:MAG: ABC transporter permease subunit [Clostridiales bacterium]|nr:ABC transporter permease subunit [Clostridiales bacterium]
MNKLLSANYIRLRKDKFFWLGMAFMFAAGIFFPVMRYMDAKESNTINNIDNGFFGCALFIGIIMAVFCSLFIGTEYSDGTIRNKIVVGHKRVSIYLTNLFTTSLVSIAMCVIFFVPYLCIGIPLLGFFEMNIKSVLLFALTILLLAIAFSSIFTLISMLNHNKVISAIICILLSFGLLLTGTILNKMLEAPEIIPSYSIGANGEATASEMQNPKFLDGTKREIVQFVYDFIPGGQAIQCAAINAENLHMLPIYSIIIIVFSTGAGLFFFKKKELK